MCIESEFKLKLFSWNINGGFEKKFNDFVFLNFICIYDVIFLFECWIENEFDFNVLGFICRFILRLFFRFK